MPIESRDGRTLTCGFCHATQVFEPGIVFAQTYRKALERVDAEASGVVLDVAGARHHLLGKLAGGEHADVFLAERVRAPSQRVVVKVARDVADRARLDRERAAIAAIRDALLARAPLDVRHAPYVGAHGRTVAVDGVERAALVLEFRDGYFHTLADVARVHRGGVDGRALVWIGRRIVDGLRAFHAIGWAHGGVAATHVLVHPRDHLALFVGWSRASKAGAGEQRDDVKAAGRVLAALVGPASLVPSSIADAIGAMESGACDAATAHRALGEAAQAAYGPPAFHRFVMPGFE
jgi:hypothetical protein